MSYIEVLILRHLSRTPAHGYELRKRVEATTGVVLHNNSLYPALRRFEEAGAVTKTAQPQEGRPPRHVYQITGVGRDLLHDMLADLPVSQAEDDNEFLSRLGQFALLEPAERAAVLDARQTALHERLGRLQRLRERSGGEEWGQAVTSELIRRGEAELAWLTRLRVAAAGQDSDLAAPGTPGQGHGHGG
jgi:DNA-binding PadR family transcriptional regulator